MRIVHVVRQFHPAVGARRRLIEVAGGQRSPTVIVSRGHAGSAVHAARTAVIRRERRNGVDIVRIPFFGSKRYPIAFSVIRHIRDADIVHVHGVDFFCDYLAWTAPLHRRKLVLSTHGGFFTRASPPG